MECRGKLFLTLEQDVAEGPCRTSTGAAKALLWNPVETQRQGKRFPFMAPQDVPFHGLAIEMK